MAPGGATGNSSLTFSGPWSLLRWLDSARDISLTGSDELILRYSLDSRRADLAIEGITFKDQLVVEMLKDFRCPGEY